MYTGSQEGQVFGRKSRYHSPWHQSHRWCKEYIPLLEFQQLGCSWLFKLSSCLSRLSLLFKFSLRLYYKALKPQTAQTVMEKFSCLSILCSEQQRSRDFIPNWSESEVRENQTALEQSFQPHTISTPSVRVSGWNITLPENGFWGGCCQVHEDGFRIKETTKRVTRWPMN